jgi:hypothetical protein
MWQRSTQTVYEHIRSCTFNTAPKNEIMTHCCLLLHSTHPKGNKREGKSGMYKTIILKEANRVASLIC